MSSSCAGSVTPFATFGWLRPASFNCSERTWIIAFAVGLAVLTTLPYLFFAAQIPPGRVYTWTAAFHHDDYFQYFAWARHIADGDWLIRNYYTSNPEASFALFNPFFLLMGWVHKVTQNVYFTHHLLRILCLCLFCHVSYAFIALFLRVPRTRITAQILLLGGGLEYPWYLWIHPRVVSPVADMFPYRLLYRYAHLVLCLCMILVIFGAMLEAYGWVRRRRRDGPGPVVGFPWAVYATMTGLTSLMLGLVNPYYIVLVVSVTVFWTACLCVGERGWFPVRLAAGSLAGCMLAGIQYIGQPVSGNLASVSFDEGVGMGDFLLFFMPILLGALPGYFLMCRRDREVESLAGFLPVWLFVVICLVFSPLAFRVRLLMGVWVALAIPAAEMLSSVRFGKIAMIFMGGVLLVDPAFNFYKEAMDFRDGKTGTVSTSFHEAMYWLDQHAGRDDVVLALDETSNMIPAYCRARMVVGHSFQTDDYYRRRREVKAFFTDWGTEQRGLFLKEHRVSYIVAGPRVEALSGRPGIELEGWQRIYHARGWQILTREKKNRIQQVL